MRSPRNRRFRPTLRYAALSILAAASLSLVVLGIVRFGVSASVATVVGSNSATVAEPSSPASARKASEQDKLQNVSGLFLFELDNTLQKLENIGTSNDVSYFTFLADSEPVFSPDGSKILFRTQRMRDFHPADPGEALDNGPDRFNQRRLTFNSSTERNFSFFARWSKDHI
ncbi:MAG: hypothetical protein IPM21_12010 [Acidobacteria bacterium]|nr:hypothetical protein [Acidobacteriota bacterium]